MTKFQFQLSIRDYVIILLTLATAVVHFTLLFPDVVFILNGLGYLALVAALYLPLPQLLFYRNRIRWVLMGYTIVTVVLWVLIGEKHMLIAYLDKIIEIVLIILLWMESQKADKKLW